MAEAYGSAFVSQYGEEPNDTWIIGLMGFSPEQLHDGFTAAMAANHEYVPGLPRMIEYCSGSGDWESKRLHKYIDPATLLENHGAREKRIEHGKSQCADILASLKTDI